MDESLAFDVQIVYLVMGVVWFLLIVALRLDLLGYPWLLFLPFLVFGISTYNLGYITHEVEDEMFKASYLSIGLILAFWFIQWMSERYQGNKRQFASIVNTSLVLTLLTFVDIWFDRESISVLKHLRSCLQTLSITLFILGLLLFHNEAKR